ncbi:NAD(P)/FAD-dependent oxidoreductase [Myxosarcina sp. GI1]|uniref:NAD(P)/FAD-dependent oxidoreductase n=1 Tax=Myxosarcina sp. GI1 TaxID=1541065 RepID=UPI00055E573E|nr:FAD-binding protein [Myxosarcina sp. GI1]
MINRTRNLGHRAIVIGGSVAGMLAARILIDYFAEVIIVERDTLPTEPKLRQGVPQSAQPHILLTKGYRILLELLGEDFNIELIQRGALTIDWAKEFYSYGEAGWLANTSKPSDLISITCSRPLLEWAIARQIKKNNRIKFWEQHRVTELIYHRQEHRVRGITASSLSNKEEKKLTADLIVDCSGRNSKAPQWLKNIGITAPPETTVNPHLGYATRRYKEPEGFQLPWKVMLINHAPPEHTRLGYLARIERGEWIATLGGYEADFPPIDEPGFLDFARSLRHASIYETITQAEPISPIYAYRATTNRLRHYEKIELPYGFIVLGDAVCSLCPVYGQGMTVSALAVLTLQKWLNRTRKSFLLSKLSSASFQQDLAKSNSPHWNLAIAQDSRFLKTKGRVKPTLLNSLLQPYLQRLQKQATYDPEVYVSFMEIAHSLKSPLSFFSPQLLWRVFTKIDSKSKSRRIKS